MLKIFLCGLLLLLSQIMHAEEADITMLFVGDVMLAEKPGQLIAQGRDPFRIKEKPKIRPIHFEPIHVLLGL